MANSPSSDTDTNTRRTVAADSMLLTGSLQYTGAKVGQASIRSITSISEEVARDRVEGPLAVFGRATKGAPRPTNGMYLGSSYYELSPSVVMNSLPQGLTFLRLTDQMTEAHDDLVGASISDSGVLSHRNGSVLGTAYLSTQGTIICQIPRWQQED